VTSTLSTPASFDAMPAIAARLDQLADLVWLYEKQARSAVRPATDREMAVLGASPDHPRPLALISLIDGELWHLWIPLTAAAPEVDANARAAVGDEQALEIAMYARQMNALIAAPMQSTSIH
jgi:hypothetical protein